MFIFRQASHSHANLLNLPATRVLPEFVNKPPAVDTLQDFPLIVIPEGGGVKVKDTNNVVCFITCST